MRGNKAKAARATGMLHKLRKKYIKAEQIGMRKAAEQIEEKFNQFSFFGRIKVLFYSK